MSAPPPSEPSRLLHSLVDGDPQAAGELLPLVYNELHRRARGLMREPHAGRTLQPTALIHEAFLRLVDQQDLRARSRLHFVQIATKAMRHVLADHARARHAQKRGGGRRPVTLDDNAAAGPAPTEVLLAVEEALGKLAEVDAELAEVVELRFFGGLEHTEIADLLGVSVRTVERSWRVARAWLANAIEADR